MKKLILLFVFLTSQVSLADSADDWKIEDAKLRVTRSLNQRVTVYNNKAKMTVEISNESVSLESIFCDLSDDGTVLCILSVKRDHLCAVGSEIVGVGIGYGLLRGYLFGEPVVCTEGEQ